MGTPARNPRVRPEFMLPSGLAPWKEHHGGKTSNGKLGTYHLEGTPGFGQPGLEPLIGHVWWKRCRSPWKGLPGVVLLGEHPEST
jgi:hypothetical protein